MVKNTAQDNEEFFYRGSEEYFIQNVREISFKAALKAASWKKRRVQGWARDGTGQSRDFLSRSRLSRGTTMRDSPAKICPGPARPADFCPGPGPTGHK